MSRLTWELEANLELNSGPLQKQCTLNPMSHISNPRETSLSQRSRLLESLRVAEAAKIQASLPI